MAEYLASIHGTEKDKVNCPFYFKIGACRHGDRCSRTHNRPPFSQTLLLQNFYQNPLRIDPNNPNIVDEKEQNIYFEEIYEDVFVELQEKYGELEELNICDNLCDHLLGNVYVKFKDEDCAEKAMNDLNGRWFAGRPIHAELSPVTDFREACCRQYEKDECDRGGSCNFMHVKQIKMDLAKYLLGRNHIPGYVIKRDRSKDRDRDHRRGGGGGGGNRYDDRRRRY